MAPTESQERRPNSPLGVPWPLWIMFVTYISASIVIYEKVLNLERDIAQHIERVGHRGMEQKAARIEERIRNLERDRISP